MAENEPSASAAPASEREYLETVGEDGPAAPIGGGLPMAEDNPAGSAPSAGEPALAGPAEPDVSRTEEDPGYLTQTGEAVGEDGSIVPIIGGLPAVEGSAWDIGAPRDERGAGLAEKLADRADED